MVEIALAVVLFFSRWTNKPAAVVLVLLALFQAGQSYFNEQMRYTSADPVIPIDNFGVLVLCALAVYLTQKGQPWPVRPPLTGVPAPPGMLAPARGELHLYDLYAIPRRIR